MSWHGPLGLRQTVYFDRLLYYLVKPYAFLDEV